MWGLEIKNAPIIKEIEIPVHPDKKEKRKVKIGKEIYISKNDFDNFGGKEIRLLHLFNIRLDKKNEKAEFTSEENKDIPKINWTSFSLKVSVLMPDGKWVEGFADSGIKNLKRGEIIQFERFGFVRFDEKKKKKGEEIFEFWFAHR